MKKTNMIFCHDNKFETKNNKYYSNGIFINDNMTRYTNIFDNVTVIARKKLAINTDKLVEIDNKNVQFKCVDSLIDIFNYKKRKMIEEEVKKSDYVIARVASFISYLTLKYAKKYKKPYLLEVVGDTWGSLWNHSLLGKIIAPYMLFKTKREIKNAKYVLYVTNVFLQKIYPTKGKAIGCSDVELKEIEEEILEKKLKKIKNRKEEDQMLIATIAAVNVKYKGQEYVIKAIAKLNKLGYKFKYLIVGNGNQERLRKIAKKYKAEEYVEFLGGIPHNKVFELLDDIDIYIQPSVAAEGLPRAMVEAMSRGCLCVGTNVSGIPELLEEKYIFEKRNIKELIDIIKNITKEDLKNQAIINFEKSKQYEKSVLNKRREEFFKCFYNQT